MGKFVLLLTIALAIASAAVGIFCVHIASLLGRGATMPTELRWVLVLGMPVLLGVSYVRLSLTPPQGIGGVLMYSVAQVALFLAPFTWWHLNSPF
jgi:hypothetical protein